MHLPARFRSSRPSVTELWHHIHFPRWWPRQRNSTSGFVFWRHLWRSKWTCRPNFGEIYRYTAEMLLPVSENKRPPCWNSIYGFDFYLSVIMGMSFCTCVPNFVQIGPCALELWCHSDFQDGGHQPYWIFSRVTGHKPWSANEGLRLVLIFWLGQIYSLGDIAIFMLWGFGLKLNI